MSDPKIKVSSSSAFSRSRRVRSSPLQAIGTRCLTCSSKTKIGRQNTDDNRIFKFLTEKVRNSHTTFLENWETCEKLNAQSGTTMKSGSNFILFAENNQIQPPEIESEGCHSATELVANLKAKMKIFGLTNWPKDFKLQDLYSYFNFLLKYLNKYSSGICLKFKTHVEFHRRKVKITPLNATDGELTKLRNARSRATAAVYSKLKRDRDIKAKTLKLEQLRENLIVSEQQCKKAVALLDNAQIILQFFETKNVNPPIKDMCALCEEKQTRINDLADEVAKLKKLHYKYSENRKQEQSTYTAHSAERIEFRAPQKDAKDAKDAIDDHNSSYSAIHQLQEKLTMKLHMLEKLDNELITAENNEQFQVQRMQEELLHLQEKRQTIHQLNMECMSAKHEFNGLYQQFITKHKVVTHFERILLHHDDNKAAAQILNARSKKLNENAIALGQNSSALKDIFAPAFSHTAIPEHILSEVNERLAHADD